MQGLLNGIRGLHNLFQPKRNSIIGLDITATAVNLLALSEEDGVFRVECYGRELLSFNALAGTVDAVANSIKKLFNRLQLNCKQVAVAVPDAEIISKVIQINDSLHETEIEELVYLEADKYIPYPIDEINFDFEILGPSAKNPSLLDVLVVAARAEHVMNRVAMATGAGLEVRVVDVASYAVERATQQLINALPVGVHDKTIAIIELNVNYIQLFVLHDMKLIYSREAQCGSMQFPAEYELQVLDPLKENMLLQIKHALHFFYSTSQEQWIAHIVLAGALARHPGLAELIQEQIGIVTTIANPFSNMLFGTGVDWDSLCHDAPELMVACGLALRSEA